jgi:hypothetical protein
MRQVSTGLGLCVLGLCIVAYPLVDRLGTRAEAGIPAAGAVAAAALAQDPPEPTVVWMGVTPNLSWNGGLSQLGDRLYRQWSDGRLEVRCLNMDGGCSPVGENLPWREVPPPPSGNGFACRTDLNGDRAVDGVDLGMLLAGWGQFTPCNPEPEYPCVKFGGGWIEPPG